MLPRAAALRAAAARPSSSIVLSLPSARITSSSRLAASRLLIQSRTLASGNKPRKTPPPPAPASARSAAARAPPPPQPLSSSSARQPGSSSTGRTTSQQPNLAKRTTPPSPGANAAGSAAAAASATASRVVSPVQGERPQETGASKQDKPLAGDASPLEPVAQKENLDEPAPGSTREVAQDGLAASENTPAPENATNTAEAEAPQQPLPDLRQGIPSTFDFEFGEKSKKAGSTAGESEAGDKFDLTSAPEEGSRQREKGEREYDASAYETSTDRRRNQVANYLFASSLFIVLGGGFYLARPFSTSADLPSGLDDNDAYSWGPTSMYARVRARLGGQVGYYTEPSFTKLLPEVPENQRMPYTLVLSLEDLMIHTTWDTAHGYRMAKRPGLDYFIRYLSQYYELVLFTSAPRAMADPVMAKLDPYHFIMWPLGREATKYEGGEYVKDLAYLNRPLSKTLIIDTHAPHVKNQPENAIILPKWSGDPKDPHTPDLVALIPFLEYLATMGTEDVRTVLKSFEGKSIPEEFARREALARERFNQQLAEERKRKPKYSLGSALGGLGVSAKGMGGGGMVLADGQSVAEGLAQGKMLSDQIREQGQKQWAHLEQQIREHGEQWLREEKEEQQRLMDQSMKEMKQGALGWFGGSSSSSKGAEEGKK